MNGIAEFLRARYAEVRQREEEKRRSVPSAFDAHEVEIRYEFDDRVTVLVDGRPYPADEYWEAATEPAPDPAVLADLDAKLAIVRVYESAITGQRAAGSPGQVHDLMEGAANTMRHVLQLLALPHATHPDYDERWRP